MFVIIDVRPDIEGLPTTAYMAVEEVQEEGKKIQRVFKHLACTIGAQEVEEVKQALVDNPTAIDANSHTYALFVVVGCVVFVVDDGAPNRSAWSTCYVT